jgi:hypothetical protein
MQEFIMYVKAIFSMLLALSMQSMWVVARRPLFRQIAK